MASRTPTATNRATPQLLAAGLTGALVGLGIGALKGIGVNLTLLLLATAALTVTWWLARTIGSWRLDWLAPPVLFSVAALLYYWVRPGSLVLGMAPVGQRSTLHINTALGLVLLTIIGFTWGYKLPAVRIIARWLPRPAGDWQRQRVAVAIGLLWISGTLCWVLLMQRSGGISARLAGYGQGQAAGLGVLVVLSAALLAMALVLGWLQYLKGLLSRPTMIGLAAMTLPMLAVHGQRSALLVPTLMAVAIYHYQCRRLSLKSLALIAVVVMIVFVALGLPRLSLGLEQGLLADPAAYARLAGWFFVRNLTSFDALMLVVAATPGQLDYQWGRGYLDSLVMMIPRQLHPNKPQRNLFNRVLRPGRTTSMALPPAGEGYLNFGWGGALLESVLLGLLYGAIYVYRQRHPGNEGVLLTYAFFVAFFIIIFRGGLLGGHIGMLATYLVLLGAVSAFCGRGRLLVR